MKVLKVSPGFEKIGSRYFYTENYGQKNQTEAVLACRNNRGYVASDFFITFASWTK